MPFLSCTPCHNKVRPAQDPKASLMISKNCKQALTFQKLKQNKVLN